MAEVKKKKNKVLSGIVSILLVIVGVFFLISSISTIYTRFTLKKQAEIVKAELEKLEEEKDELSSIKTKLEDDNYVVTYARGEYMFSKGEEKLFKLPSKK